jgi:hypothetical protein
MGFESGPVADAMATNICFGGPKPNRLHNAVVDRQARRRRLGGTGLELN